MSVPWRHHSVPQFLLRNFADADGLLWHFDKRKPQKGIGHDGPKGLFYEEHQYSTVDYDTGELDPQLERFFDLDVENPAAPIIERIISAAMDRKRPQLSSQGRSQLDWFMQFQARRVPEIVESNSSEADKAMQTILANLERDRGPLSDWFDDPINMGRLEQNAIVDAIGSPGPEIAELLRTRGLLIAVITDPKKAFIIGSNPMVPFPQPGFREFGVHGYWLLLSSNVAISFGGPSGTEDLRGVADHSAIRQFNELAFKQSNAIAGRSRKLTASLINSR